MGINKVQYGNTTLIDLTSDTVTADKLMQGYTAHDRTGALITGTATGGSGSGVVWQDAQGYVHLSDEGDIPLQTKTVTPSETAQTVTADAGYYALDEVSVGAISPTYVGSGITRRSSTDLTASGATVTVPNGYYSAQASKAVSSGSAGTPTATKGSVSNHAISVTPSVTNTTGYITGGTKTGTAVSVSASELVSGTIYADRSGSWDVTNVETLYIQEALPTAVASKGSVSNHAISVTPSVQTTLNDIGWLGVGTINGTAVTVSASELVSGTKSITENGTGIDVTNYASVDVAVPTGGCTCTITGTGSSTGAFITYNGNTYTSGGFAFAPNDSITVTLGTTSGEYDAYLYINDVLTEEKYNRRIVYEITPNVDISIKFVVMTGYYCAYVTMVSDIEALTITQNGTYTASGSTRGYSPITVSVSGGGGGEPASKKQINFIDYDGTILHSYTKSEWQSVSSLPSNPSHSGLTAQGWNWTKAQIDTQLTAMPDGDIWIGQMYITDDGKTRIYIHLEEGRLHPYLGICPNGTVVVDWGDNSATSTLTGTSLTTVQRADHTYTSEGDYTITLTVSNGSFAFYGSTSVSYILNKDTTTTAGIQRVYVNAVKKIEIGSNATFSSYALCGCYSLESITIPSGIPSMPNYVFNACYSLASITIPSNILNIGTYEFNACYSLARIAIPSGVTSIGNYAFAICDSLTSITIPSGVTNISTYAFQNCYSLARIQIPSGVTSIGNYVFRNCYPLERITIPSNVTSIGSYAFNSCYSLTSITIPSNVTSIGTYAFQYCYGLTECHVKPTTPPTLGTTAFGSIPSDCIIYVPSASLEAYQTASNWSTYASYMQGE